MIGKQTQPKVREQKTLGKVPLKNTILQQTCACGEVPGIDGLCTECRGARLTSGTSGLDTTSSRIQNRPQLPEQISSPDSGVAVQSQTGHNFSRVRIQAPKGMQTKLTINQPGDQYEQEADSVAEQVLRMDTPPSSIPPSVPDNTESADGPLVRKQISTPSAQATPVVPPIVNEVVSSDSGQPLDQATRAFMEPRFRYDFGRVRIHTDARAAESAQAVNAVAYTMGRNVVFRTGAYAPATGEGRRLLAHELTHVMQQSSISPPSLQRETTKKQKPTKKQPPKKSAAEREQEEESQAIEVLAGISVDDEQRVTKLITAIKEEVLKDEEMLTPKHFPRNWRAISEQVLASKPDKTKPKQIVRDTDRAKDPHMKKTSPLFPGLYQGEIPTELKALGADKDEKQRLALANALLSELHQRLIMVLNDQKRATAKQQKQKEVRSYEQEREALISVLPDFLQEDTRADLGIDTYIGMRDTFINDFVPTADEFGSPSEAEFSHALQEIKKFYTAMVKADFLETQLGNTRVHNTMRDQLQKAKQFLTNQKNPDGTTWLNDVESGLKQKYKEARIGGVSLRPNKNNPENISEHAFGRAVDISPDLDPNVHPGDFPKELVEELTGEDVYGGSSAKAIQQGADVPTTLKAVERLHKVSDEFKSIFASPTLLKQKLAEYLNRHGQKQTNRSIAVEEFQEIFKIAEQPFVQTEVGSKKKQKQKPTVSVGSARAHLLPLLRERLGLQLPPAEELRQTEEMANFLLTAYRVFHESGEVEQRMEAMPPIESSGTLSTQPGGFKSVEEKKKVAPDFQGKAKTIAAYGFINLPDKLITALIHSSGGNLNWLGKQEKGTKDFMHFELKPADIKKLPGEGQQKIPAKPRVLKPPDVAPPEMEAPEPESTEASTAEA